MGRQLYVPYIPQVPDYFHVLIILTLCHQMGNVFIKDLVLLWFLIYLIWVLSAQYNTTLQILVKTLDKWVPSGNIYFFLLSN